MEGENISGRGGPAGRVFIGISLNLCRWGYFGSLPIGLTCSQSKQVKRELADQKKKVLRLQEELARAKLKLTGVVGEAKEKLRQAGVSKPGGAYVGVGATFM